LISLIATHNALKALLSLLHAIPLKQCSPKENFNDPLVSPTSYFEHGPREGREDKLAFISSTYP